MMPPRSTTSATSLVAVISFAAQSGARPERGAREASEAEWPGFMKCPVGERMASTEPQLSDTTEASGFRDRGVRIGRESVRLELLDQGGIITEQMATDEHANV